MRPPSANCFVSFVARADNRWTDPPFETILLLLLLRGMPAAGVALALDLTWAMAFDKAVALAFGLVWHWLGVCPWIWSSASASAADLPSALAFVNVFVGIYVCVSVCVFHGACMLVCWRGCLHVCLCGRCVLVCLFACLGVHLHGCGCYLDFIKLTGCLP